MAFKNPRSLFVDFGQNGKAFGKSKCIKHTCGRVECEVQVVCKHSVEENRIKNRQFLLFTLNHKACCCCCLRFSEFSLSPRK